MSFPGSHRIRRLVRKFAPKAIILLYHRVARASSDPQLLCVTPEHFAEHMQILRRLYHPLSLRGLQQRWTLNSWPSRSVIITFDDGYADNLHQARPLLEAHDIPATVFVTSGSVDAQQEFWWDDLERIFLSTPALPAHLEILVGDKECVWDLGEAASLTSSSGSWNVLAETHPTPRQQAYLDLMRMLHGLGVETRESVLSELVAWAGIDTFGRQDHLAVKADELCSLPKDGLMKIGAHTVNHIGLSALSPDSQRAEIVESKSALERILERPVLAFAYPFGERRDYTPETTRLVREAGFVCACSNFAGHVTALSDPYQLPRFIVRDWDGETFARKLEGWFRN